MYFKRVAVTNASSLSPFMIAAINCFKSQEYDKSIVYCQWILEAYEHASSKKVDFRLYQVMGDSYLKKYYVALKQGEDEAAKIYVAEAKKAFVSGYKCKKMTLFAERLADCCGLLGEKSGEAMWKQAAANKDAVRIEGEDLCKIPALKDKVKKAIKEAREKALKEREIAAVNAYNSRDFTKADQLADQVLVFDLKSTDMWNIKSRVAFSNQNFANALLFSEKRFTIGMEKGLPKEELVKTYCICLNDVGVTIGELELCKKALALACKYLKKDSSFVQSLSKNTLLADEQKEVAQASQHMQQGKFVEAAKLWEELLKKKPHHLIGLKNLGGCYGELGRYAEAIDCFEKALAISPKDPEMLGNLSRVFLQRSEQAYANEDIDTAKLYYGKAMRRAKNVENHPYPDKVKQLKLDLQRMKILLDNHVSAEAHARANAQKHVEPYAEKVRTFLEHFMVGQRDVLQLEMALREVETFSGQMGSQDVGKEKAEALAQCCAVAKGVFEQAQKTLGATDLGELVTVAKKQELVFLDLFYRAELAFLLKKRDKTNHETELALLHGDAKKRFETMLPSSIELGGIKKVANELAKLLRHIGALVKVPELTDTSVFTEGKPSGQWVSVETKEVHTQETWLLCAVHGFKAETPFYTDENQIKDQIKQKLEVFNSHLETHKITDKVSFSSEAQAALVAYILKGKSVKSGSSHSKILTAPLFPSEYRRYTVEQLEAFSLVWINIFKTNDSSMALQSSVIMNLQ